MTARQIEQVLTQESLASWHRVRSTNELLSLISRREAALATVEASDSYSDFEV